MRALILLALVSTANADVAEPFAFGDFTWLNGNSRVKDSVIENKYFSGTFMADVNYIADFNHPQDHTLIGSTSAGRTQEFQVEQLGVGGDFHYDNVRGRVMTQFGMYSTMTPRNDGSTARGQWDLNDAYRYVSEAYGGYHWNVWNGINLDAGIFMSYIGLFSYYNNENWAYQASYTSANTPWFFNGLRLQMFPSDHLKVELWLINGWQSYAMYNEMPGLGYQILYRSNSDNSFVSNGYWGTDTLNHPGRNRFHTDTSFEHRYWHNPKSYFSQAAFSVTGDLGCESGDGVSCSGDSTHPGQYFVSAMAYNRLWFDHDLFAFTVGAGFINNPGRYLVLLPPNQTSTVGSQGGSSAVLSDANSLDTSPGSPFHAWDASVTFDYMPSQYITWRAEFIHRQADVNYFAGPGGITGPDGNNNAPLPAGWTPDLVKSENRMNFAMLVRF